MENGQWKIGVQEVLKSTLFDDAVAIGKEELFEVFHLLLKLLADVSIPDQHAMSGEIE